MTLEGSGQPERDGERHGHADLLGFLSEFRAASSPVSQKLGSGSPEAEAEAAHPVADPTRIDDPSSDVPSPSPGVPAWNLDPDPPVRTRSTWAPDDEAARWPAQGTGESRWPPPPPGTVPVYGAPVPSGAPASYGNPAPYGSSSPYSNAAPYSPPWPGSRPGRGKLIGIITASLVGLILILVAIPTVLGSRSGLHPAFVPAGYKAFTEKTDRFSLAVPDSWESVDPSSPGAAEAFQQMEANNPAFQSAVGGDVTNLASRGMKFLAVGEQSSVNVVVKPLFGAGDSSLTQLQSQLPSLYQSLGATLVSNEIMQLNGRETLQATVDEPFNEPNGSSVVIAETQDFFAAHDLLYSLTLAGSSTDLATIGSTFDIGS